MKRLLAYLFIVLGLGLTFSVNSISETKKSNPLFCEYDYDARLYMTTQSDKSWKKKYCKEISPKKFIYKSLIKPLKPNYSYDKKSGMKNEITVLHSYFDLYKIDKQIISNVIKENSELYEYKKLINRTLITKAEPSETGKGLDLLKQQVEWKVWVKHVDKDYRNQKPYIGDSDYIIYDFEKSKYLINPKNPKEEAIFIAKEKCRKDNPFNPDGCLIDKINEGSNKTRKTSSYDRPTETKYYYEEELKNYLAKKQPSQKQKMVEKEIAKGIICHNKTANQIYFYNEEKYCGYSIYDYDPNYDNYYSLLTNKSIKNKNNPVYDLSTKKEILQIAKAEPSQMQEVTKIKQVKVCLYNDENIILISNKAKGNCKYEDGRGSKISYEKLLSKNPNMEICYRPNYKTVFAVKTIQRPGIYEKQTNKNCNQIFEDAVVLNHLSDDNFSTTVKTKVVKVEPTITTKKEVKVAKVEEPKQEEFKPENKDIDNDAPVIEIAENITVNDTSYIIEGKVTDKSKKLFVQIDGETIPVNKGKFKIKRFSPVDEQLKIIALDQWGNKSKPKIVKITIDLKDTELADKLDQLNPSLIKSKSNKNRVALIIGIEKYEQTPAANFANLDAQYFYEYARKGFGIPKSNIKLLVDEDANLVKSISSINKWLPSKIKKNKTELIIFFAGHGLASNNGEELYILPQDSDPDLLSRTALSRTELFEQIITLSPKSVTMFMDTCYSGISRDEKMLLASARPIRIVANDQEGIPNNFTIFTASKLDQISSGLEEVKHGIFSYYLMKGLEGEADSNQDKKITNGELLAYMDENVSQKAAELGREQNPSLAGDPNKVLIRYR